MVSIFDWLGDIITGIGNALDSILETMGAQISNAIWDTTLRWLYNVLALFLLASHNHSVFICKLCV